MNDKSTLEHIPPANDEGRRRYSRQTVSDGAALLRGGKLKKKVPVHVLNASVTGLSVESPILEAGLKPGDVATVEWQVPAETGFTDSSDKTYTFKGVVVRGFPNLKYPSRYGIQLDHLIPEQIIHEESRPIRIGIIFAALLLTALIALLKYKNVVFFWYSPYVFTYSLIVAAYIYARIVLAIYYREPSDHGYMPTVTVIVPAKNEAEHIRETVDHIFKSRYPSKRLEVIVVDDGSTDRTPQILEELAIQYPALRHFRLSKTLGKRHAMVFGMEKASHDILVCIDSDSLVDEEGIYRIVQPLWDPAVGAVAGHVDVIVEKDNFISKMEVVRYQISQRVNKASESVFNAVTCCSGPFSAYRRVSVLRVLPPWLNQVFWGARATFGDDRSLTNFILRTHRVVYHAGAHCATYVPRRWRPFFHQQLRWKKSWSREAMVAARFMPHKHPMAALLFYAGILITLFSPLVALRALFYLPVFLSISPLPYLLGLLLMNVFLGAIFYYYTRSRYWPYLFAFVGVYITALSWQTYYAMVTIPRTHWGTR